jgi:hypothetical protein
LSYNDLLQIASMLIKIVVSLCIWCAEIGQVDFNSHQWCFQIRLIISFLLRSGGPGQHSDALIIQCAKWLHLVLLTVIFVS